MIVHPGTGAFVPMSWCGVTFEHLLREGTRFNRLFSPNSCGTALGSWKSRSISVREPMEHRSSVGATKSSLSQTWAGFGSAGCKIQSSQEKGRRRKMLVRDSQVADRALPPGQPGPVRSPTVRRTVLFVTDTNEYGGAERHLLELIRRLHEPGVQLSILCLRDDLFSERLAPDQGVHVIAWKEVPRSLRDWVRLFRDSKADVVVLIYSWLWCFPLTAVLGAWLARIRKIYTIQHLIPPEAPPKVEGRSMRDRLRRLIGKAGALHAERPRATQSLRQDNLRQQCGPECSCAGLSISAA